MKNNAEVVIIGGGIIGCATAYYLAKEGVSVIVLEKSDHIGNGGSSRNGGGVRQSGRDPREPSSSDVCRGTHVADTVRRTRCGCGIP